MIDLGCCEYSINQAERAAVLFFLSATREVSFSSRRLYLALRKLDEPASPHGLAFYCLIVLNVFSFIFFGRTNLTEYMCSKLLVVNL